VFHEVRRPSDRAGAILAVGEDRDDALERAARASELIRFETVDAEALV
jgi:L-aminoacid ligase-like protein